MKKIAIFSLFSLLGFSQNNPNPGYWQQHVDYKMEVDMNVKNFQYKGKQELVYTNNSSDTLYRVFYHLYPNAFQPGSAMDARLTSISDPDKRMVKTFKQADKEVYESRISQLKPDEIGYLKISNLKQDGATAETKEEGTILEVKLTKPLLPHQKTTFTLDFDGQVPLQVRRSGRNSEEGIALSMTQWYPKMAEYDFEGWHADPYIGREFHGVWGNFDVKITIDKEYTIGGTGYLQNKNEIGHGYEDEGITVKYPRKTKTLTWHFIAPNVHDFAWGADNEYIHDKITGPDNVELHFFYKNKKENLENWKKMQPKTAELLDFYNKTVGPYPYKQYSVVQGGDGGMEYAMCTLITGNRSYGSLVGVTAHEFAHSWFQHILASNESKHEWMDEGFTSFISDLAMEQVLPSKKKEGEDQNPFQSAYGNYRYLVKTGKEQPLSTHADRYDYNMAYGIAAYSKGEIFLAQLGYVIGTDNLMKTLKRYYYDYKFTHPTPNDIKRSAEKISGAILDWYLVDWTQTTNTIDYAVKSVDEENGKAKVTLERIGRMPMPLDLLVVFEDGTQKTYYIPNTLMRWEKENPYSIERTVLKGWDWAFPTFSFEIPKSKSDIKAIVIDPSGLMADVNLDNNVYEKK
ncbi:M1 family metallopeptidase [Flavobacterium sp. NRK F10]|uniref:M1 family metallopeptidase n=1 Tax=Flavobacterium sp. NRK F10 TaxID=2954931 RepID=UPI0020914B2B|nr:M1 family metallopeptidase [Flavobacterium sp. NRK F10]MCO6174711.1 M1 family metallopeptidase [Flavobacterium sp. NRK F10]